MISRKLVGTPSLPLKDPIFLTSFYPTHIRSKKVSIIHLEPQITITIHVDTIPSWSNDHLTAKDREGVWERVYLIPIYEDSRKAKGCVSQSRS